jgi:hypothetical protein
MLMGALQLVPSNTPSTYIGRRASILPGTGLTRELGLAAARLRVRISDIPRRLGPITIQDIQVSRSHKIAASEI